MEVGELSRRISPQSIIRGFQEASCCCEILSESGSQSGDSYIL